MNLLKLPRYAAVINPDTNLGVIVAAGRTGYYGTSGMSIEAVAEFNEKRGVTRAQRAAMFTGSMFGWECAGADPDNYDEAGMFDLRSSDAMPVPIEELH